ncbi:hypothetical protein BaRGS_00003239 [Batillaria attramentaria]|uniref:Uncharacterized protein n=1 Tax=Batillaria attramentaria TaxID=370345 RepID=A0ABD0M2F0_9CAEN
MMEVAGVVGVPQRCQTKGRGRARGRARRHESDSVITRPGLDTVPSQAMAPVNQSGEKEKPREHTPSSAAGQLAARLSPGLRLLIPGRPVADAQVSSLSAPSDPAYKGLHDDRVGVPRHQWRGRGRGRARGRVQENHVLRPGVVSSGHPPLQQTTHANQFADADNNTTQSEPSKQLRGVENTDEKVVPLTVHSPDTTDNTQPSEAVTAPGHVTNTDDSTQDAGDSGTDSIASPDFLLPLPEYTKVVNWAAEVVTPTSPVSVPEWAVIYGLHCA